MSLVPLFVYGTLRPNHRLHSWLENDTATSSRAELHGAQMWVPEGFWFPIVVESGELDEVVIGDLLMVHDGTQLRDTVRMEMGAGYKLVRAHVWADDRLYSAYTFIYDEVPAGSTRVLTGDWEDWEQMQSIFEEM